MSSFRIKKFVLFPKTPAFVIGWFTGGFVLYIPGILMFNSSQAAALVMFSSVRYFYLQLSKDHMTVQVAQWKRTIWYLDVLLGKTQRNFVATGADTVIRNSDGEWMLRPGYKYDYRTRCPWIKTKVKHGFSLLSSPIPLPPGVEFTVATTPIDAVKTFTAAPAILNTLSDCLKGLENISKAIPTIITQEKTNV